MLGVQDTWWFRGALTNFWVYGIILYSARRSRRRKHDWRSRCRVQGWQQDNPIGGLAWFLFSNVKILYGKSLLPQPRDLIAGYCIWLLGSVVCIAELRRGDRSIYSLRIIPLNRKWPACACAAPFPCNWVLYIVTGAVINKHEYLIKCA